MHCFRLLRSAVATDADIELAVVKSSAPAATFAPSSHGSAQAAQAVFSSMLTSPAVAKDARKKTTLADRCKLSTLSGLIEHATQTTCSLLVEPRNFAPAYITKLTTATDVLFDDLVINAYHRKNELPQAPRSDEPSTVRFDASWGMSGTAAVHGFVKRKNVWFMVLKGAHLSTDSAWPRGAGMYPTNLKPEAHHHRSKWVSFHSLVMPEEPHGTGVPLVGSALVGFPSFRFILDGREITVSAD